MAIQDLTPQLRTRLNRMEKAVGWFVFIATALLLFGFGYYVYNTAENRGWFKIKAKFFTYLQTSDGLNVGDNVKLMGFAVGKITKVEPMPPRNKHNVKVEFEIVEPWFRQIYSQGSYVIVNASGFIGRDLEVTRGTNGYAICVTQPITIFTNLDDLRQAVTANPGHWQLSQEVLDADSNTIFNAYDTLDTSNLQVIAALKPTEIYAYDNTVNRNKIVASWHPYWRRYENFTPEDETAWLKAVEAPPVADRLNAVVAQVEQAMPNILALTNKLAAILDNTANATSNLNVSIALTRPMITNFGLISANLREPGGLAVWALGTNAPGQVGAALDHVNSLLVNTDTNMNTLVLSIGETLDHVADITSNLNAQVQANSNMLWGISKTITDTDDLIQGLKRHWLLRSAFKHKEAKPEKK
jgi:ABC-type transporter Mla subunit MlaD